MKAPDRGSRADYERNSSGGARNGRFPVNSKPESVLRQRTRQQLRGDVDDRYHALIRHARRPDHPDRTDYLPIGLIRRRDDAAFVEWRDAGLAADVDLHSLRVGAQLEDLHEQRLLFEELEQLPQPGHVRGELMRVEQIPLAGYDIVLRRLRQGLAARLEGRGHEQRHILPELLQLVAQAAADVVEREAGVVLVEEIRRHGQL